MQSSSEKLPLIAADGPDSSSRLCKKRPLETTNSISSTGPLKKRLSVMATDAPGAATSSAGAFVNEKANAILQKKAETAGFNPLDLLSEISATASILERKGDPLAHYQPRILNNLPEEEDEAAKAALAAAPAHVQMKSQMMRRRQMLARLQNTCGYQNPAIGRTHEDVKLPSWQRIPAPHLVPALASKVAASVPEEESPAVVPKMAVVAPQTKPAVTAEASVSPADAAVVPKVLSKKTKKKAEAKSKPKTAWKKKLASAAAADTKSKKTTADASAPKREYNYQPLGGRSYCWM